MKNLDLLRANRGEVLSILNRQGLRNVRVFGSSLHREDRPDSDIDLLVEPEQGVGLFKLARAAIDLEQLLCRPVDLLTPSGLPRDNAAHILKEAEPL